MNDNSGMFLESRKGALSGDLKALAAKHKVKTYKELIEKIQYIPSAET